MLVLKQIRTFFEPPRMNVSKVFLDYGNFLGAKGRDDRLLRCQRKFT